jgi:CheY-like chemotaxis protein
VIISVRDTGVGIPPEKLPQMFEPFAQGERSIARSEGGLGLGLTIVRTLVEMHGGTVIAESEGVGKGSEFTVRLHAATGESVAHVPEPSTEASQDSTCQARILVVDDNADTAHGLARLLTRRGYAVKIAFDGRAGLETARQYRPQIILLDIGLPGMDGFEVAAELRRESCCEDALLIAISGYGQAEDLRQSRAAGFDHHLIKPVDLGQLHQLLEQWCERSIRGKGR